MTVATTGGVTLTAATLEPVVSWILQGAPHPIPENVPFLLSAGIITATHGIYNLAKSKGWLPLSETTK